MALSLRSACLSSVAAHDAAVAAAGCRSGSALVDDGRWSRVERVEACDGDTPTPPADPIQSSDALRVDPAPLRLCNTEGVKRGNDHCRCSGEALSSTHQRHHYPAAEQRRCDRAGLFAVTAVEISSRGSFQTAATASTRIRSHLTSVRCSSVLDTPIRDQRYSPPWLSSSQPTVTDSSHCWTS